MALRSTATCLTAQAVADKVAELRAKATITVRDPPRDDFPSGQ